MAEVEIILALLLAVAALAAVADRIAIPFPILLVVGGAALGLVPGLPRVEPDPDILFLLFVPPLVFYAAFFTSWRDFVANARSILSLAVGLVLVTIGVVAAVAHGAAGIPWAPAFVLAAVVANTDTTAIAAIGEQVRLPRRISTILEGESLVNDAVGLTGFRIAVIATVAGVFSVGQTGGAFVLAVVGAIPIGLAVGWLTAAARARTDDSHIVIIIGLLTPFAAYLPAEQIGASGILAVVIAGLFVGRREPRIENANTRLRARAVWELVVFVIDGLLFILVGLQLRSIWSALRHDQPGALFRAAAAISLAVILTRIVWVALSMLAAHGRASFADGGWRGFAIIAWAGLRGGDTLAAALSTPFATNLGAPFPARAEIVFFAFVVIAVTLVGQGLTLPLLIRRLGVVALGDERREEILARRAAAEAALARLATLEGDDGATPQIVAALRKRYAHELAVLSGDGKSPEAKVHIERHRWLEREALAAERTALLRLRDEGAIGDEVLRRVERELDLEEARLPV